MTFDELGAALRAERERRGLRIEDVADHLKISARHLRALEEGDGGSLPHPAYTRGFIRSYAAYLGISSEEIHDALTAMTPGDVTPQPPAFAPETAPRERRSGRGGMLLVLVLLLVAGGGYAVWHWGLPALSGLEERRLAQPSPPLKAAQPAPASESAALAAKSAAREKTQSAPAAGSGASSQQRDASATATGQSAAQAEPQRAQAGMSAEAAASASRQEERADAPSSLPTQPEAAGTGAGSAGDRTMAAAPAAPAGDEAGTPGQHKVIITATEECWIHSNADRTDTRQFSLRKGDTFALTFARSLELKLGNAGGVRIRYDGQSLPPPGQSGQVKTLTFPPQAGQ